MTKQELLQAIATTSGMAGIDEFNACQANNDISSFIKWYEQDISFCSQKGKELGEKVLTFLNA